MSLSNTQGRLYSTLLLLSLIFLIQNSLGQRGLVTPDNEVLKNVFSHTDFAGKVTSKKPLDFNAMDGWAQIGDRNAVAVSSNGDYISYSVKVGIFTDSLVIQSTRNTWRRAIRNQGFKPGFFSADGKQYIYRDNEGLHIIYTGKVKDSIFTDVSSFKGNATKDVEWLAIQLANPKGKVLLNNLVTGKTFEFESTHANEFAPNGKKFAVIKIVNGIKNILIRELSTGQEEILTGVQEYQWSPTGQAIAYVRESVIEDRKSTSLCQRQLDINSDQTIMNVPSGSKLISYVQAPTGERIAVLIKDTNGVGSVWHWRNGMKMAEKLLDDHQIKDGLVLNVSLGLFGANSIVLQLTKKALSESLIVKDIPSVDVWGYRDTVMQQRQSFEIKNPTEIAATFYIATKHLEYLESSFEKSVTLEKANGEFALIGRFEADIYRDQFWKKDYDSVKYWLVTLATGERRRLPLNSNSHFQWFTPDGKYLLYFATIKTAGNYYSLDLQTGKLANISQSIPSNSLNSYNEQLRDRKDALGNMPTSIGRFVWIEEEKQLLVYDRYDIWLLDVTGKKRAINLTNGYGRRNDISLWLFSNELQTSEPRKITVPDPSIGWLVAGFNRKTKSSGFFSIKQGKSINPSQLFFGPYYFQKQPSIAVISNNGELPPIKADGVNEWLVQRQSMTEAPNYYLTSDFKTYKQITHYAPHQSYNWLTSELHQFKGMDHYLSLGVLYKPENFDPKKKYPVIISFYWNLADRLNQYPTPKYLGSPSIFDMPAWMVSQGYLVFLPDMSFNKNKWGPSSQSVIDGAIDYLAKLPYVDEKHIGAAGHSNSGTTGYYVYTHSKKLAAMVVGSGLVNIMSSNFEIADDGSTPLPTYAEKQSSAGAGLGQLWKNKENWIDHTAVLQADKATCPLLLFQNRVDGAFSPGGGAIAMYLSLRRMNKPCWWLQYDNGNHVVDGNDARDFTIRYTQYFDHYLKGAPPPKWMTKGVAYKDKGKDFGYELDPEEKCSDQCPVCNPKKRVQHAPSGNNLP